ncbi:MAG: hypothetical protein H6737_07535 [Alphaproteobacteria bacterium]|nr:hypothetical protein [Alphaproteobacteria bacterium]
MWFLAAAFAAAPGNLAGTWVYAGGEPEIAARADVIESTAQTFNFAFRGMARSKLTKVAVHDETITIGGDDSAVRMVFRGDFDRESEGPSDGTPVELRGANVRFDLVPDRKLVITGESENGGKESTYELTPAGTLKVTHKVWSGMLSAPMVWTLSYARK